MAELDERLKTLLKDKRVLIGAAVIGAVAGLYVLSKNGGAGGGLQPEVPQAPQQPGAGDSPGYDDSGIIGRLTQIEANQQGLISQFTQAISDAINGVRGENASALQSVIDQVNSQLGSGQAQAQTVPDFAGFQSQLTAALAGLNTVPQRVPETGDILKRAFGAGTPPKTIADWGNRAPNTLNSLSSALKGRTTVPRQNYASAIQKFVSQTAPKFTYPGTRRGGGSSFVGSPSIPRPDFSSFNRAMGAIYRPTAPKAPAPVIKRGGNALLRGR